MPVTRSPGSRAGLLPPSPLRTARASFPACRSSLSNARGRARLCSVQRLAMDLPMAGGMQEHPVVCRITASVGPPDDVMLVPARQSGDLLMADRAKTLLGFPEGQQLPSALQVVCHLHAYACFEVHFPLGIVRVCRPFDLPMPLDRHVSCTTERAFLRLPVVAHACPHEGPLASLSRLEVFLCDPAARFLRMSPCGPGPQRMKDRCVHFDEDRLADHMAMRVGPPANDGVELRSQMACRGLLVGLHDMPEVPEECVHMLRGGFHEEFPRVLPDMLSQEIAPALDMRDRGFCLGKLKTPFAEKVFHQRFDFLFQHRLGAARDHAVITIPHKIHLGALGSLGIWRVVCPQKPFEPVKRQVGNHRGANAPLGDPGFGGIEQVLVNESGLEPLVEHGCVQRDVGQYPFMAHAVETGSDVALQDPWRGMLSGQHIEALFDRIRGGALRPEALRVWVAERFRHGIEREEVQRLHRTIVHRRDRQRTLATRAICLRNVDAPKRQGAIATLPECLDGARFLCRGVPHHIVDPWGLAAIVVRHSFDGSRFAAERVGQQMVQGTHLAPSFGLHRLHHTCLGPPDLPVDGVPMDSVPCHRAVGECTSQCRHCRHLPSLLERLAKVSGDARPEGRLRACAWGDVACGLNPYPPHYRMAFASSLLLPHTYRLALRLTFPYTYCMARCNFFVGKQLRVY